MKSLYIHIPFCTSKCFYCSFVVAIGQEEKMGAYVKSLLKEAVRHKGEQIETIYLGGGTPSKLSKGHLEELMKGIEKLFDCSAVCEITIEMNPEDATEEKLKILKGLGVGRISLGVQTFNDSYLEHLGRNHNASAAVKSIKLIQQYGFKSVSMDLMFGFEKQSIEDLNDDLNRLVALSPDHVSLYGLTIDPQSKFFTQGRLVSSDLQGEMYKCVLENLRDKGYLQYEVSNFSKKEHESKHNKNYWLGGNYFGLGVGAHSLRDGRRWWNIAKVDEYISNINQGLSVEKDSEALDENIRKKERVLFGLRMNQGVELDFLGESFQNVFTQEQSEKIDTYIKEGLLAKKDNCLVATDSGRLLLDEICAQLV